MTIETKVSYERSNHFSERLTKIQAYENTNIPEEVYEKLRVEIKKYRLSMDEITNKKIRGFLKKIGENKYYNHVPYIVSHLTHKKTVKLSKEIEEKLRQMFFEIQDPYEKHKPSHRKNFLNYNYRVYYGKGELLKRLLK